MTDAGIDINANCPNGASSALLLEELGANDF
jgi:hypothetical protein